MVWLEGSCLVVSQQELHQNAIISVAGQKACGKVWPLLQYRIGKREYKIHRAR